MNVQHARAAIYVFFDQLLSDDLEAKRNTPIRIYIPIIATILVHLDLVLDLQNHIRIGLGYPILILRIRDTIIYHYS